MVLEWNGTIYCPIKLLMSYLKIWSGPHKGHLFCHKNGSTVSDSEVGHILKCRLHTTGFDTSAITQYSLHIEATTTAAEKRASLAQLKLPGRWKSEAYKSFIP